MLLVYLVEEGRHQEDGGLSQKLVDPLAQHRLIEVSVKHIHILNHTDLYHINLDENTLK